MERVGCGQSAPQRSYLDQKDLPTSLSETRSRVLVTGGASGIGKATAELLGARGYAVGLLDRDGDRLAAVLAALSAAGVEAAGEVADVADSIAVDQAVSTIAEALGGLDGLVTAAGIGDYTGDVTETGIDAWQRVIAINLTGVFHSCRAAVVAMRQAQGGAIVNISSQFGLVGSLSSPAYCAAKAGVIGLTKAMALDHAHEAMRVNCVCPGPVDTPMLSESQTSKYSEAEDQRTRGRMPLARNAQPGEIAATIAFLLSPDASYLTGAVITADGGWTAA
jgi:NAD(P)-dependent dehydrogenase (short-subunit alcohol dehydrogenase family)